MQSTQQRGGRKASQRQRRARIEILPSQRVCLFGRTGSGKTTLARQWLKSASRAGVRILVLDPKWEFRLPGAKVVYAFRVKEPVQILRVPPGEGEIALYMDAIEQAWRRGKCIIYLDEATLLTPARTLPAALGKAIRTGRSRGVGVWIASQRPKDIPSAIFTEAEHFAVFQLTFEADRDKVVSFTGDAMGAALPRVQAHDFAYYNVQSNQAYLVHATKKG